MTILLKPPAIAVGTRDLTVLAQTILGEAEGEPLVGKVAVAWVVVNRALQAPKWPNTIAGVCLQPRQFSCWNAGSPRIPRMVNATFSDPYYRACYGVACMVLAGEYADVTAGAQFYFTRERPAGAKVWPPAWSRKMEKRASIGAHDFYREG